MPVIPPSASYDQWLDPTCQHAESLKALLRPYASEALPAYSVGTLATDLRHDAPKCLAPVSVEGDTTASLWRGV
jgi:putative SOS response-associated peptidase YedK